MTDYLKIDHTSSVDLTTYKALWTISENLILNVDLISWINMSIILRKETMVLDVKNLRNTIIIFTWLENN